MFCDCLQGKLLKSSFETALASGFSLAWRYAHFILVPVIALSLFWVFLAT